MHGMPNLSLLGFKKIILIQCYLLISRSPGGAMALYYLFITGKYYVSFCVGTDYADS